MLWTDWTPPVLPERFDGVFIGEMHVRKANALFPALLERLAPRLEENRRAVVTVCGGSGVGKTGVAALLGHYFRKLGTGCLVISGDDYPRRIPCENDAERLRVFRQGGLLGLLARDAASPERQERLRALQREGRDSDPAATAEHPWLAIYQHEGRKALAGYLGSADEQGFDELNGVIARFQQGANRLWLRRMGRDESALSYEPTDCADARVLIVEWTHGNSDRLRGADAAILLQSTPKETLAGRLARGRDTGADSPFVTMVLELEQRLLDAQARSATLILSGAGELLSYRAYRLMMAKEE